MPDRRTNTCCIVHCMPRKKVCNQWHAWESTGSVTYSMLTWRPISCPLSESARPPPARLPDPKDCMVQKSICCLNVITGCRMEDSLDSESDKLIPWYSLKHRICWIDAMDMHAGKEAGSHRRTVFSSKQCPVSLPDPPFCDMELHSSLMSAAKPTPNVQSHRTCATNIHFQLPADFERVCIPELVWWWASRRNSIALLLILESDPAAAFAWYISVLMNSHVRGSRVA